MRLSLLERLGSRFRTGSRNTVMWRMHNEKKIKDEQNIGRHCTNLLEIIDFSLFHRLLYRLFPAFVKNKC